MKRPIFAVLLLLGSLLIPMAASAAQIRAFVDDFTVSPADSSDFKNTLQRLFNSRLSGDGIKTVETRAEADVIVSGSYTRLGKMFSIDAFAKSAPGELIASAFEQGESIDSLIPAVGKISSRLKGDIVKLYPQTAGAAPEPAEKAPASEIIRSQATSGWTSQRIVGEQRALAALGAKDFLVGEENAVRLYRQDNTKLVMLAEAKLPVSQKIIGIDTIAPDSDGRVLAFVTIVDRETPASRIYAVQNGTLKRVSEDLPYFFRAIALNAGPKQLYAQQMGPTDDYYGNLFEASYAEGGIKLKNPIKMPRFANIFNFNVFRDQSGKSFPIAFSESGYLIVYSESGEELWRSSDKFGGSETYFQRKDSEHERTAGTPFRTRFIDQRIVVSDKGEIIVPQNDGFYVVGNSRSYSRYSLVSFAWNGASLEELWRTKPSKSYLADYAYLPGSSELALLEVTQKAGLLSKGGSMVRVIRAE